MRSRDRCKTRKEEPAEYGRSAGSSLHSFGLEDWRGLDDDRHCFHRLVGSVSVPASAAGRRLVLDAAGKASDSGTEGKLVFTQQDIEISLAFGNVTHLGLQRADRL